MWAEHRMSVVRRTWEEAPTSAEYLVTLVRLARLEVPVTTMVERAVTLDHPDRRMRVELLVPLEATTKVERAVTLELLVPVETPVQPVKLDRLETTTVVLVMMLVRRVRQVATTVDRPTWAELRTSAVRRVSARSRTADVLQVATNRARATATVAS